MNDKQAQAAQIPSPADETSSPRPPLTPQAQRALAEAEARRVAAEEALKENIHNGRKEPKEIQGPAGPEPTRYGDWENKGIASDF
jgi:hypothetical protein